MAQEVASEHSTIQGGGGGDYNILLTNGRFCEIRIRGFWVQTKSNLHAQMSQKSILQLSTGFEHRYMMRRMGQNSVFLHQSMRYFFIAITCISLTVAISLPYLKHDDFIDYIPCTYLICAYGSIYMHLFKKYNLSCD